MQAIAIDASGQLSIIEVPQPRPAKGEALLRTLRVGICATDREMVRTGTIFTLPPGEGHLILGHEGVAEVVEAGPEVGLAPGDVVVPLAYRRCPEMALPCRVDMCPYGRDRRAGINSHGMFAEYLVRPAEYVVAAPPAVSDVAMLLEPLTVSLKPFMDATGIRERHLGLPCTFRPANLPTKVLIVGIGPIGMLGVFAARALGWETVAVDLVPEDSPKSELIRAVGATYHDGSAESPAAIGRAHGEFDLVVEAVQEPTALLEYVPLVAMNGIFVLLGWSGGQKTVSLDLAGFIRDLLTKQVTILASTGAGRPHYEEGMRLLSVIDERYGGVLQRVVTHRYPVARYEDGFTPASRDQIKAVIEFASP
jgi:glucose 1-dehydrogenase